MPSARPRSRAAISAAPITSEAATADTAIDRRTSPTSGHGENAERHEDQPEPHGRRPVPEAPPRAEKRPHFAEPREQLADEHRDEGQDDDAGCRTPATATRVGRSVAARRRPEPRPGRGPPTPARATGPPGRRRSPPPPTSADHRADAPRAPPPARRRPRAPRRPGFQSRTDASIICAETAVRRPATSPATGPPAARAIHHDEHDGGDATQRDPERDGRGIVAPGGQGEERPEVVEDRAVVDPAGRRRGPRAASAGPGRSTGSPASARPGRCPRVPALPGPEGAGAPPGRPIPRPPRCPRRDCPGSGPALHPRWPRSVRPALLEVAHAAGVRDRAPCTWKASDGSGSSGSPAARARARPMFTAS